MNILKPKQEKLVIKEVFGFDVETYGNDNKFLMGSIVGKNFKKVFWDYEQMKKFLLGSHKLRGSLIFASNLGFDFLTIFDNVNDLKNFHIILRDSNFISCRLLKKNTYKFYDTMNFLKVSVKNLGEILGIPKLKKPECIGKKVTRYSKNGQILEQYNIRDSYISYKFGEFMQSAYNSLGINIKSTIASSSFNLFQCNYLKHNIIQPKREVLKEFFKAYYGGRTEAFYRGYIKNKYLYDINSLYPYVMYKYNYPNPNSLKYTKNPTLDIINKYKGISLCEIKVSNKLFYPLLPHRFGDKLYFPIGKFEGWHNHAELRKALEIGYKIKPIKSYYYTQIFNPFKDFVYDLYNKRLYEKNKMMSLFWKINLNSLYGKFAQRLEQTELFFIDSQEDRDKITAMLEENDKRDNDGYTQRYKINTLGIQYIERDGLLIDNSKIYFITDLENNKFPHFINPILSIYITGYARLELYDLMVKHNAYYVDTDSIITDNHDIKIGDKLGSLKKEIDIKNGIIIKPKLYYIQDIKDNEIIKAKGLSNLKDFYKLIDEKQFKYTKFSKFKESLRRNLPFNAKIDIIKIIDFNDNKRLWKKDIFKLIKNKEKEKSRPVELNQVLSSETFRL